MKKRIFTGAGTALVTPMKEDGSINYTKLESLVNSQIESGIDALIILGTTGESPTIGYHERDLVVASAVKSAGGRVPVIVGAGSNDTARSVTLANLARDCGADALLMVTPFYNKTSQNGIIRHYNYIADRVDLPMILYNVPSRTGLNIKPETYFELSKHPNICAVKEANGNMESIRIVNRRSNITAICSNHKAPSGQSLSEILHNLISCARAEYQNVHKYLPYFTCIFKRLSSAKLGSTLLVSTAMSSFFTNFRAV